ncbi:MAG: hypothetical protein HKN23_02410, partial [Verrucomicrobiales bacterium]|nr:hypothetical protein [Verrucomicrobiales bacterium]
MKVTIVILWIVWALLFLAWPADLLIVYLQEPGEPVPPDRNLTGILGLIGFLSLAFTFVLKWLLLRFVIHPKRVAIPSPGAIAIFIITSFTIWGLTKSVETYGLVLFFSSESMTLYLAFWIPSLLVMLIHMPFL